MYFLVFGTIENASQYKMSPFSNKMTSTNYIKRANGSSYGTLSLFNFFFSSVTSQKGEFGWERKIFNIKKSYNHNIFTINFLS